MEISQDEDERAKFRSRRKAETDRYSDVATAEERGELRGEARGRAEERLTLAKKLRNRGISVEDIAVDTGLTVDEILRL
jgi:predicted transposase/invertase (TIGR01784 family)